MTPADLAAKGLRVDSLRALYEAVKAGGDVPSALYLAIPAHEDIPTRHLAARIVNNGKDLTAALALHNAVLPGWGWSVGSCSVSDDAMVFPDFNCPIHGDRLRAELPILINGREWPEVTDIDQRPPGDPARALMLADLAAMIEQEGEG
jgi:hypothetical protein